MKKWERWITYGVFVLVAIIAFAVKGCQKTETPSSTETSAETQEKIIASLRKERDDWKERTVIAEVDLAKCKENCPTKPAEEKNAETSAPPETSSWKAVTAVVPAAETPCVERRYVVREGNTLSGIAQSAFGDLKKIDELAKYNNIANPNLIFPGQVIRIPCPETTPIAKKVEPPPAPAPVVAPAPAPTPEPAPVMLVLAPIILQAATPAVVTVTSVVVVTVPVIQKVVEVREVEKIVEVERKPEPAPLPTAVAPIPPPEPLPVPKEKEQPKLVTELEKQPEPTPPPTPPEKEWVIIKNDHEIQEPPSGKSPWVFDSEIVFKSTPWDQIFHARNAGVFSRTTAEFVLAEFKGLEVRPGVTFRNQNLVSDSPRWEWDQILQPAFGVSLVKPFNDGRNGEARVGVAWAEQFRGSGLGKPNTWYMSPMVFTRGFLQWDHERASDRLPGKFSWEFGNLSPQSPRDKIGNFRAEQGITVFNTRRFSITPQGYAELSRDTLGQPWANLRAAGGEVRFTGRMSQSTTLETKVGLECSEQYRGVKIINKPTCGVAGQVGVKFHFGR